MAGVTFRNVSKFYDKQIKAVENATFEVMDKEFVVLVGPSGCGKSTLLRMIAGLEDVSDGEIFIEDRMVNDVAPKERDIAMVFQNYALYPHMTVYENMAFGLKIRKYSKQEIRSRVIQAAENLAITELLDRKPKALSGGQRQRVALGRAIVRHPKVFLFDEPLSNLDAKLRVQMRTEISRIHNRLQTTMIYVTHDQIEAMTMGQRIVVLNAGIIQQIDTPLNLYNSPKNKFVAGFLGSPSMNFLNGKIIENNGLWFDEGNLKIRVLSEHVDRLAKFINKEIIFGIRPEEIYDSKFNLNEYSEVTFTVEVVEPMGNEIFLYLTSGLNAMVARLGSRTDISVGQKMILFFNTRKCHFFDKLSEETII